MREPCCCARTRSTRRARLRRRPRERRPRSSSGSGDHEACRESHRQVEDRPAVVLQGRRTRRQLGDRPADRKEGHRLTEADHKAEAPPMTEVRTVVDWRPRRHPLQGVGPGRVLGGFQVSGSTTWLAPRYAIGRSDPGRGSVGLDDRVGACSGDPLTLRPPRPARLRGSGGGPAWGRSLRLCRRPHRTRRPRE